MEYTKRETGAVRFVRAADENTENPVRATFVRRLQLSPAGRSDGRRSTHPWPRTRSVPGTQLPSILITIIIRRALHMSAAAAAHPVYFASYTNRNNNFITTADETRPRKRKNTRRRVALLSCTIIIIHEDLKDSRGQKKKKCTEPGEKTHKICIGNFEFRIPDTCGTPVHIRLYNVCVSLYLSLSFFFSNHSLNDY